MNKEIMLIMQMVQHNFDPEFTYNTSDINWDSVINILLNHRIFINAYKVLVKIAPKQYMNMIEQTYDDLKHQISINISKLEEFASEAEKEHVRFVLVKGLGLAQIIYDDYFLRQANDLDILVENDDMIRGDFILKKLGYKQPNIFNYETLEYTELDYPIMRLRHTNHYFEYYTMDRKKWCKVELHKKLFHISMEHIDDFLWNTCQIDIKSKKINTLNLHYSLIMQFANTFENSETLYSIQGGNRVREYIDLYNFLEKFKNEIDWGEIRKLLTKYRLVTITRIVIDNLAELYNNADLLSYKDFLVGLSDEENVELWNLPLALLNLLRII